MKNRFVNFGFMTLVVLGSLNRVSAASILESYGHKTSEFKIGQISVGRQPKGVEVTPDGEKLYVANLMGELIDKKYRASVDVVDMASKHKIKTILTPTNPRIGPVGIIGNAEVAITPDNRFVLVSRTEGKKEAEVYDRALLNIIDVQTDELIGYVPLASAGAKIVALKPTERPEDTVAYITNWFSEDLTVVSMKQIYQYQYSGEPRLIPEAYLKRIRLTTSWPNPQKEVNRKPGDARQLDQFKLAPRGVAFTTDGKYAIAIGYASGTLFIIDASTHEQVAEVAPFPGGYNLRHIILSNDGRRAYLSHMRGDAVSAIDLPKLIDEVEKQRLEELSKYRTKKIVFLQEQIWSKILVPWGNTNNAFVSMKNFPKELESAKNYKGQPAKYDRAEPNTIVLDPSNKYLIVSCRASTRDPRGNIVHQYGKVDIIDTDTGEFVISLVGGLAPTALTISRDGQTIISSGFEDQTLHFFNFGKIKKIYEDHLSRMSNFNNRRMY